MLKEFYKIPVVDIIRNPSRGSIVTLFSLLIIFSYALCELKKRFSTLIIFLVLAFIFVEFWPFKFTYWYYTIDVPKTVKEMERENNSFTILNIPFSCSIFTGNSHGVYLQTIHKKPIIDGYLSRHTKESLKNLDLMMEYLKQEKRSELETLLTTLKVRYIIFGKEMFKVARELHEEIEQQLRLLELIKVYKIDENELFTVYLVQNKSLFTS